MSVAQLPRSRSRAGTALAGVVADDTALLRHPAALEPGPVACQPGIQVIAAGTVEAAPMSVTQRVDPAADVAATRHDAGAIPGQAALWVGNEQQPFGVPLATQPAVPDQRGDPLDPPAVRRRDAADRPARPDGSRSHAARAHRAAPAARAWPSTAARMSAQREKWRSQISELSECPAYYRRVAEREGLCVEAHRDPVDRV
jgi:hypothetical protein